MSKHTPEPWQAHQDASGDVFISSAATSFHIAEIGSEDDDTAIPDARRIVACVNACRGLPTDELEQKGLVAAVGTQLLDVERQRDELLTALEDAVETIEWMNGCSSPAVDEVEKAIREGNSAISKAKGGAA